MCVTNMCMALLAQQPCSEQGAYQLKFWGSFTRETYLYN